MPPPNPRVPTGPRDPSIFCAPPRPSRNDPAVVESAKDIYGSKNVRSKKLEAIWAEVVEDKISHGELAAAVELHRIAKNADVKNFAMRIIRLAAKQSEGEFHDADNDPTEKMLKEIHRTGQEITKTKSDDRKKLITDRL